ncbi:MAG: dihydrofolate reductase [Blastocatellia bacterium]|jgi:dihydrofolate reductase|nr:dihydrofolate reductase [Blastocatellia bacterium]
MAIIGIVAVDRNGAIGKGGKLPWHYSPDLKFFKQTTTGHTVVMGHRTWLTLQKPLPNRLNVVLSRTGEIPPSESLLVKRDVESVLAMEERDPASHLFIIGGATIYEAFMPFIERWIVTEVPLEVAVADTFVPAGYLDGFELYEVRQLDDELRVKFYERS